MLMSSHHLPAPRSQHDLQVADGQGHAVKGQGKAVKWQSRTGSEMTVNGQAAAVKRRVERSRKAVEWPVRGQRKAVNEWPDLVGGRAVHAREVNRDRPAAARQPAGDLGRCHHVARRRQWVDCVGLLRRGRRTPVKPPPPAPAPGPPALFLSFSQWCTHRCGTGTSACGVRPSAAGLRLGKHVFLARPSAALRRPSAAQACGLRPPAGRPLPRPTAAAAAAAAHLRRARLSAAAAPCKMQVDAMDSDDRKQGLKK